MRREWGLFRRLPVHLSAALLRATDLARGKAACRLQKQPSK